MLPQRISFQPSVGRSIPSDLLRAMPGHWQLRELAGAYANGNGRCLNVSSECRRPRAASALRCHPVGSCDDVYYDAERKRIYALGERFISVIQQNDLTTIRCQQISPLLWGCARAFSLERVCMSACQCRGWNPRKCGTCRKSL